MSCHYLKSPATHHLRNAALYLSIHWWRTVFPRIHEGIIFCFPCHMWNVSVVTVGSDSSRKPSHIVTIIAISAEISPAICMHFKRIKRLSCQREEGHGSIKEQIVKKRYCHKSTWRQSTVYSLPLGGGGEQMLCRKCGPLTSDLCFASRALLHRCPRKCCAGCKRPEAGSKNVAHPERNQLLQRFKKSSPVTALQRRRISTC